MSDMKIRPATPDDLSSINSIYNHYVLRSTSTYQLEPETADARVRWFRKHGPAYPVIVSEWQGRVVGWGSLSPFHARAAYARTVEDSIYIHHDFLRRGIGAAILADLIQRASRIGHHTIIACIDGEQTASIALHERAGFLKVGHMRELGWKFHRWLDVVYMQLML